MIAWILLTGSPTVSLSTTAATHTPQTQRGALMTTMAGLFADVALVTESVVIRTLRSFVRLATLPCLRVNAKTIPADLGEPPQTVTPF